MADVVGELHLAKMQHILCVDAQDAVRENERCFRRLSEVTIQVNQCIADHPKGRVSNSKLKKAFHKLADGHEDCGNSVRTLAELIPDYDTYDVDDITKPPSPVQAARPSHYPRPPGPSPPVNPQNLGIQSRPDGARRRVQHHQADTSGLPQPCGDGEAAVNAGPPAPGGDGPPPPAGNAQAGQHQDNGCCPYCVRAMILACGRYISAFIDLVVAFFRALWHAICRAGREVKNLALWLLQRIAEGWQIFGIWIVNHSEEVNQWVEEIRMMQ